MQGQVLHGDMDPGSMGLAEALDSQNLAQHLIKPYSDHAHLHIVNAQDHLSHSVQGGFPDLSAVFSCQYVFNMLIAWQPCHQVCPDSSGTKCSFGLLHELKL